MGLCGVEQVLSVNFEKNGNIYPVIVTNKHVVRDMENGELRFLKKNKQ